MKIQVAVFWDVAPCNDVVSYNSQEDRDLNLIRMVRYGS